MKWLWERVSKWPPIVLNGAVIIFSVFLCIVALLFRFPGTAISGVGTNWLLIWVVSWSVKRTPFQGILAGLALGFIQDGLTAPYPTHAIGLALAGFLTALIQKQRFIQEEFISVALIVFGMAVLVETTMAIEISFHLQTADWLPAILNPNLVNDAVLSETSSDTPLGSNLDYIDLTLAEVWSHHQRVALSSAIVSSLWAPIVYYPLNLWWQWLEDSRPV